MLHANSQMPPSLATILLPGLDGTGMLFDPLLKELSKDLQAKVIAYPTNTILDYAALERLVEAQWPERGPVVTVAESFSGPLAIRLAARPLRGLIGLVLAGSFVRRPIPLVPQAVITPRLLQMALSPRLLRFFLVGSDGSDALVNETIAALSRVSPSVLVARARQALTIDVRAEFVRSRVPTLYLQGTRDRLIGARTVAEQQRMRTNVEYVRLDAPHFVLQRCPAAAARAIEHFIARCSQTSV
jgi:pimeloyl-[acyl-carrier protein] methyl ester esterase